MDWLLFSGELLWNIEMGQKWLRTEGRVHITQDLNFDMKQHEELKIKTQTRDMGQGPGDLRRLTIWDRRCRD